ncbi:MAG: 50S ribosomal protein L9 [Ignavibacteria bacterium]|nr:50S ribosomal protein L9 [Ignavibacteria bacterium]
MKVILRQTIDTLGQIGEIVDVKDGYAQNYLIPKQYAYLALKGNLKAIEEEKKQLQKRKDKEVDEAKALAAELEKVSIQISVQVGEEDKIFGSVTSQMIADKLKEKGFDIEKRKIEIDEQIKSLGIYDVKVKVHQAVLANIKVWVVRE